MSPSEEYVLLALQSKFGGEIQEGEDPPDAYLQYEGCRIAVEVSSLVEQVGSASGRTVPRLAWDKPAEDMINEINLELTDELPATIYITVGVPIPINNLKKTKLFVKLAILDSVLNGPDEQDVFIEENQVSINIRRLKGASGKKVIGYFASRYSSANLEENARNLLKDRIYTKSKKCKQIDGIEDYWLALYNHYWVADAEIYKSVYHSMSIDHHFSKVLVVDSYKQVVCL